MKYCFHSELGRHPIHQIQWEMTRNHVVVVFFIRFIFVAKHLVDTKFINFREHEKNAKMSLGHYLKP